MSKIFIFISQNIILLLPESSILDVSNNISVYKFNLGSGDISTVLTCSKLSKLQFDKLCVGRGQSWAGFYLLKCSLSHLTITTVNIRVLHVKDTSNTFTPDTLFKRNLSNCLLK